MNIRLLKVAALILGAVFFPWAALPSAGSELTGSLSAEGTWFLHDPQFEDQQRNSAPAALDLEYYHEWDNGAGNSPVL